MPWLGPYPEAFVTYVTAKSSRKEDLGRVNDVSICLDDADAFDKAYGSNLGCECPYNASNALRKALSCVNNYHDKTADGQPITNTETRGNTSKRPDGGATQSSGANSNNADRYEGPETSSSQDLNTQSGGGTQGNGRDDDDRNNDNNKKKGPNPPDPNTSSDTEEETHESTKRKTRTKTNQPKTPSPKPRKTGGSSFKRTSQTRPADYRTPSAPPISPLSARAQTSNTLSTSRIDEPRNGPRQTPPNRSSRPDFISPSTDSPTPPSSEENDQENRRMFRHGRPPSRNAAGGRQPLTDVPVPPARSGQAAATIAPPSSSTSSSSLLTPEFPPHTQTLHRHSPRSRDIIDMGTAAPNIEPRDMRRASIRVMVTRDGSPIRVPHPRDANPDLITRGPQPPWRDPPIGDRPGREIEIYESPTAAAVNVNVNANAPTHLNLADGVQGLEEKGMQGEDL
ncbi:MAG: hypothetical protein Q9204_003235 [Flavoplaca sp. TL-2023a]